ncbi:hypothetical protein ACFX2H_022214 [Malus domestica]
MKLGFLGPLVLMGKKDLLIDLPFVGEKVERNPHSDSFYQFCGFSFWINKIKRCMVPPSVPKLCSCQEFPSGTFPGRRAHSSPRGWRRLRAAVGLLLHCWALSGKARRARLIGQDSSGTACRARLEEKDSVNFERCLVGP